MRGRVEEWLPCFPPHHRLRRSFPPRGSPPTSLPPLCKGVSRALCASPRCGVRARRTEVFAIVGKNRDRWRRRSLRRRDRVCDCKEHTEGLLCPRGICLYNPPASLRSAPSRIGLPQKDAVLLWDNHREGKRKLLRSEWRFSAAYAAFNDIRGTAFYTNHGLPVSASRGL